MMQNIHLKLGRTCAHYGIFLTRQNECFNSPIPKKFNAHTITTTATNRLRTVLVNKHSVIRMYAVEVRDKRPNRPLRYGSLQVMDLGIGFSDYPILSRINFNWRHSDRDKNCYAAEPLLGSQELRYANSIDGSRLSVARYHILSPLTRFRMIVCKTDRCSIASYLPNEAVILNRGEGARSPAI